MGIDEPAAAGPDWGIRPTPPDHGAAPELAQGEQPPPPPPVWTPPPPRRPPAVARLTVLPGLLLFAAAASTAVLLVRHHDSGLTTPESIAGEQRLSGGQYDGAISAMQDLLKKVDPQIQSVVFAAYGATPVAAMPAHLVYAEKGVSEDPTTGVSAFSGMKLPLGAGSLGLGSPTVAASGGESFTCLTTSGGGIPQMTMCFWSDTSPANAGGVLCLAGAEVHSCADYAGAARRAVLGG